MKEFNKRLDEIRRYFEKFTFFYDKVVNVKIDVLIDSSQNDLKRTKVNLEEMNKAVEDSKFRAREAQEKFYKICDKYINLTHKILLSDSKVEITQLKKMKERKEILELNYKTAFVK
jgi:hypothetical protein